MTAVKRAFCNVFLWAIWCRLFMHLPSRRDVNRCAAKCDSFRLEGNSQHILTIKHSNRKYMGGWSSHIVFWQLIISQKRFWCIFIYHYCGRVCVFSGWSDWHASASTSQAYIVLALKASCHACLITNMGRNSEVSQSWQMRPIHFFFASGEMLYCFMKMLISHHSCALKEYLLKAKHNSGNRPRTGGDTPQHLLPLCEGSLEISLSDSLPALLFFFYPSFLLLTLRAHAEKCVSLVTRVEKFNDRNKHLVTSWDEPLPGCHCSGQICPKPIIMPSSLRRLLHNSIQLINLSRYK